MTQPSEQVWITVGTDGYSDTDENRAAIAAGAAAIDWTYETSNVGRLRTRAMRRLITDAFAGGENAILQAGSVIVTVNGERVGLVGLQVPRQRYYVLDLVDTAVYVMREPLIEGQRPRDERS